MTEEKQNARVVGKRGVIHRLTETPFSEDRQALCGSIVNATNSDLTDELVNCPLCLNLMKIYKVKDSGSLGQ